MNHVFHVGHENFARDPGVTFTSPSALSGFPASRLYDELDFEGWRPSGLSYFEYLTYDAGVGKTIKPDYIAILGHNMGSTGKVWSLQESADMVTWNPTPFAVVDPIDDRDVVLFGEVSPARGWRIILAPCTDTNLVVSEAILGRRVKIPDGVPTSLVIHPDDRALELNRSDRTGDIVRVGTRAGVRRHKLSIGKVEASTYELEEPEIGLYWWWREIVAAGRPFVASTVSGAAILGFPDAGFYGRTDKLSAPMEDIRARGRRTLSATIVGRVT